MNVTTEQDFRQAVFATISAAGIVNFRLRSQNIQGRTVPSNFRLGKTISVSRKDIMYHTAFDGMSYEEVQLEIARQSLLSVDQRAVNRQIPTPITESTSATGLGSSFGLASSRNKLFGDMNLTLGAERDRRNASIKVIGPNTVVVSTSQDSRRDTTANGHKAREERPDTSTHTPARADGRDLTPLRTNEEESSVRYSQQDIIDHFDQLTFNFQVSTSKKTGTPKALRKFLADEAKKRQRPLAPVKVPHTSTPPRKPSPISKKHFRCSRITPWRFYGTKPPEPVSVAEEHEPNQKQSSEYRLPMFAQSSNSLFRRPKHKPGDRQTAESCNGGGVASCGTMSPKFDSPTVARQHRYDSSDNESFPDVEELYKRMLANKTKPSGDASTSEGLHILHQTPVDTRVAHKGDVSQVYSDPRNSDHVQARTRKHTCHSEDLTGPKVVSNEDTQNIQDRGITNVLSSSQSKKRPRHRSKSKSKSLSKLSDSSGIGFIGGIPLPESREATSSCDTRSAKRRKGPGHVPKTHNMADRGRSELGPHFSTASAPQDDAQLLSH
ncbi:hypothetical protein F4814DRAFT_416654 [Daldinia grandis]|nr:hypothetical protein F4814DRAFT_416654 [Daldinia grandis]